MSTFIIAAIVIALAIGGYALYRKRVWRDIKLKLPAEKRTDLLVGPYGSYAGQIDRIAAFTNLHWYFNFHPLPLLIEELKRHLDHKLVFDMGARIFTPAEGGSVLSVNAEQSMRLAFDSMRAEGVLHRITYLVVHDEPQLSIRDEAELQKAVTLLKAVAATYSELAGVKYACIYLNKEPFWCLKEFDVVGVDCYKQKSESLTRGEHARLRKAIDKTWQKTMIIPGASYGHNPDPWLAYAQINKDEVAMLVPFLWTTPPAEFVTDGLTGIEDQDVDYRNGWIGAMHYGSNKS